jgi:PAS domain-containing protein
MEINFGTAVIESLPEGFTLIDSDWRYLYVNQAALIQSRMTRQQLIGYRVTEVFPGIEHLAFFKAMTVVMESREAKDFLAKFEIAGKEDVFLDLSIRPSADGIVIISSDLSVNQGDKKASLEEVMVVTVLKQEGFDGYLFQNSQPQVHV